MKSITLRKATLADIRPIQTLYRELDHHHVNLLPHVFRLVDGDVRSDETLASWINAEDRLVLLAEADGVLAGFVDAAITAAPNFPIFVPRRFGLIHHIHVTPARRKQGIGTLLTAETLAWFRAKNIESVAVQVWNKNHDASGLYARAGFAPAFTRMELSLDVNQVDAPLKSS
jgi:GNAT superfamily N-acetyltransferase